MTRPAHRALGWAVPLLALGPWVVGAPPQEPEPRPPDAVPRGASLGLFASDPGFDYGPMLDEMVRRGAREVLVVDRWMQSDVSADDLERRPGYGHRAETVSRTVRQARARGMRVSLMPIVGLRVAREGQWRGVLQPTGGADGWFAGYRALLVDTARRAQADGVSHLIVGSEMNWLEHRDDLFRRLVAEVRAHFEGTVSYSANWDRYRAVRFWDALDAVAVSGYFRSPVARPTRSEARDVWAHRLTELEAFARARRRPLLLSEVGYPAHAEAATFPWDETRDAPIDQALQATLLGAFCDAQQTTGTGYFVWNWFGTGGPRDRGYTPRGKPAAAEFERCMHRGTRTP